MTTDIETIKATVRSRLTTRLAPPANPIGAPFDHGDYIIEELAGDLIGFTRVNAFYDPSIGLPQDPSELDRYIATATANCWTKNNIYTYLDGTWHETEFEPGLTFAYVIAEDNYYGAYPTGWQELSIGGIDDYVTLTTDQNITGQKTFDQAIGVGTTNPQNMLHINGSSSPGLQISNGFSDGDDGLSINLEGSLAVYKVSYTGSHIFGIETRPGVWETGLVIGDTPVHGPAVTTPQIVVGEPTESDMGIGSLNAEALYVNGEPVITGTFDIDDYVTLTTDQNISGQKNFTKQIGIGTTNPQRLLHLNTDDSSRIGIGLGRYGNVDNYLSIDLDGNNASYNIGYSGSHVFEVETAPGTSEIGLWISGQYHKGPTVQAYQLVAGNPYGWGMGAGSINAEALYVEGEPVVTGTFDPSDYYTKTNLKTSGQSSVHAENITNVPWLTSLPSHNHDTRYYTYTQLQTSGQSQVHADNITNAPWLTSLPSHNHDTDYYTKTNLSTSGESQVHAGNITNAPWLTSLPSHNHDTRYYKQEQLQTSGGSSVHWDNLTNKPSTFPHASHGDTHTPGLPDTVFPTGTAGFLHYGDGITATPSWEWRYPTWSEITNKPSTFTHAKHATSHLPDESDAVFPSAESWGYLKYSPFDNAMVWSKPSWGDLENVPTEFPPEDHNHDDRYLTDIGGKPWVYKGNEYSGSLRGGYNTTRNHTSDVQDAPVRYMTIGNFNFYDTKYDFQMGATYTSANRFFLRSFFQSSDAWNPWVEIWNSGNLDPSDYALVSHNHSATDINSGVLSNSRLSFNPDYFVQGTGSRRSVLYDSTFPLDSNIFSTFCAISSTDPANTIGEGLYGFRASHPTTDNVTIEVVGRSETEDLFFGGRWGSSRNQWRQIHHSGVSYITYDNNPAEVSHPSTSEDLGTSNQTLHPTKGIYYAPGRSDTQIITMGNPQFAGQVVEIVHNGLQSLQVYCGPANPPMIINVPEYSILRLRAISTPGYSGWSPVI